MKLLGSAASHLLPKDGNILLEENRLSPSKAEFLCKYTGTVNDHSIFELKLMAKFSLVTSYSCPGGAPPTDENLFTEQLDGYRGNPTWIAF